MKFTVAARADRQIRAAAAWWAKNRTYAPALFAEDLEAALDLIEEFPYAGEVISHRRIRGLRRVLLSQVRYHLYYEVVGPGVVRILSLWHTSRGRMPRL